MSAQHQSPVKSVPSKGCCRPSDSSLVACTAISAEVLLLFRDPGPPVSRPLHFVRQCVFSEAPATGTTRFRLCRLLLCDALRFFRRSTDKSTFCLDMCKELNPRVCCRLPALDCCRSALLPTPERSSLHHGPLDAALDSSVSYNMCYDRCVTRLDTCCCCSLPVMTRKRLCLQELQRHL